jgi:ribulose-phosphate 3-epimerase
MIKVAPSILSADFSRLLDEVKKVEEAGADYLHIDVMDGHFVPNITLGPPIVESLKGKTTLPFDVHLMIENPEKYIDAFIDAGAYILTVHQESTVHLHRAVSYIKSRGVIPAVALNPGTPIDNLEYVLDEIGMILLMTVNPGFGGQAFIEKILEKIKALKQMLDARGLKIPIEVDGGINEKNAKDVIDAGAEILVAGSAIYKSADPALTIAIMKQKKPLL